MHRRSPILANAKRMAVLQESLNSKEKAYVDARAMGSPPAVAARVAGYDDPEACLTLERRETVRLAVEAKVKAAVYEQKITREDVLAGLLDAVNMSATAAELTGAWREIGKLTGAYEPAKIDLTVNDQRRIKELDDRELLEMAAIDADYEVIDFDDDDGSSDGRSA